VQEWLPERQLAREVVEGLDLSDLERAYAGRGGAAYYPAFGCWDPGVLVNRWHSAFRGPLFRRLLEQDVQTSPITYRSLLANPAPKAISPAHPVGPPPLAVTSSARPWRDYNR
jgi:hypothetical protein